MITLDQSKTPLFTALKNYKNRCVIPFDVPGHKHGNGIPELTEYLGYSVMAIDVNSMKPLDNLANPVGVIKEAEMLMANAYNSDYSFFLVNGTTQGIQGMIMSICNPGDKIILPRNVHKSVTNALILSGAIPVYIEPLINNELGIANGISVKAFEATIKKNKNAKAVLIINPTYYGMVSDLEQIITIAHKYKIAVLVDEAHGAHFQFNNEFPSSAMSLNADMAAVSFHKTGGSLTQSSVLLLNENYINKNKVKTTLNMTQTTSASYLLLSSLDVARKMLVTEGKDRLDKILILARYAREQINNIPGFIAFGKELIDEENGIYDFDETKLGINVKNLGVTGLFIYDLLRDEFNIQVEFGDVYNILAIISLGDTKFYIDKLIKALKCISLRFKDNKPKCIKNIALTNPKIIVSPRTAFYSYKQSIPLEQATGEISAESVMAYPPGIPIVAPGERIDKNIIDYIKLLKEENSILTGTEDPEINYIKVLGRK